MRTTCLVGLLLFCTAVALQAATIDGMVTKVIDGDSLIVERSVKDGKSVPIEVRLEGIDAPEGCQAGGPEAREALRAFVDGKRVSLEVKGKDSYGRTLATLRVGALNINERLVAEGHAWSTRFKWDKGPYVDKERVASALKRGLHATPGAVQPRDFRRTHGPCAGEPSPPAVVTNGAPPVTVPAVPVPSVAYRCDGRTRCTQMSSCAEATWFLQHCPGVQMDGNGDGVPCERQWCR